MPYTKNPRPVIRCQYWDTLAPAKCKYWNAETPICTYEVITEVDNISYTERGDLYPLCNYIGTASYVCTKYDNGNASDPDSEDLTPRCVLPDPYSHISKSPNCGKWINITTVSGEPSLDFSDITGYNNGKCNFAIDDETTGGTDSTCTGHTPQHLGFSGKPIPEKCTTSDTYAINTAVGDEPQLPMNYVLLNMRVELGKCMWWNSYDTHFMYPDTTSSGTTSSGTTSSGTTSSGTTSSGTVEAPEFKCVNSSVEAQEYAKFFEVVEDKYVRPPCNGAAPDCPKYTGNLASTGYLPYLSNVFIRHGDKVLAEQILELRYNIKKETWNPDQYDLLFADKTIIYAHDGVKEVVFDSDGNIIDYSLDAVKVKIAEFKCLAFERKPILLTKGTAADDEKIDFPALIEEIGQLPLSPIIHSSFETQYAGPIKDLSYIQKREYVYETPYTDHKSLLIVGDHFSFTGEPKTIFAINISDPDISFPFPALFNYTDMYAYKQAEGGNFGSTHTSLECYFTVLNEIAPDKIYYNTFTNDNRAFMIDVLTIFGENRIMVFDTSRDIYSYGTITINKHYCGGVVAQTGFKVTSPDNEVSDIVDYEFLNGHPLFKPELSYSFKSFHSSDGSITIPYHTYLDTKITHLKSSTDFSTTAHHVVGYKMYRIKVLSNFFVDTCDSETDTRLVLLGNAGYVLVIIDDGLVLHSVIRNWDTGELDENGNPQPMDIVMQGLDCFGKEASIAMTIVEYCSDRLEVNQMILKPKNANSYVRLYGPVITLGDIYVYERWSFGETPDMAEGDYQEIRDGWAEDDIVSRAATTLTGDIASNKFTIKHPPIAPIIAAVMYKGGVTFRIKGQAKTDLMNWVKQPFCSDVEISYTWSAAYRTYTLLPTHYCFVENIGVSYTDNTTVGGNMDYPINSYTPYCGDHSFGRIRQRPAPMWYPYTQCEDYASYDIYAGSGEKDNAPMDFWVNATGQFTQSEGHNSEDLRMLGPAINYGWTSDVHTSIWACGCDWTHMNGIMQGVPWFSGWARIRSGVEGAALYLMTQNGGQAPKFGNKKRGYLMSYRSTAFLSYYVLGNYGEVEVKYKWMPPYEGFTDLDLGRGYKEYPWNHYFNISDNTMTYMSQFGLLAAQQVDGVGISEKLVTVSEEDSSLARFRFTDIFKAHHATLGTRYPEPRKRYYIGDLNPKPITAWLTYIDPPEGDGATQWAWRELWKKLVRGKPNIRDILMNINLTTCELTEFNTTWLSFLDMSYPNYTYDYRISEFRRVVAEGGHAISWEPSIYDPDNPLPTHFLLGMDGGPKRLLSPKCELITTVSGILEDLIFESIEIEELEKHLKFYDICSEGSWLNGVSSDTDLEEQIGIIGLLPGSYSDSFMLYSENTAVVDTEEDAILNATEGDREVVTTDGSGEKITKYFNRGMVLGINNNMLQYIPRIEKIIDIDYEFSLSEPSHDDSQYSTIEPLEFYPANEVFGMVYSNLLGSDLDLVFAFSSPLLLGRIEIVFNKGVEVEDEEAQLKTFYNIPTTKISKSIDGIVFEELRSSNYEFGEEEIEPVLTTKVYDIDDSDLDYMSELYSSLRIHFGYNPSPEEMEEQGLEYQPSFTHLMDIRIIRLYTVEYTYLTEIIDTHERKFNISTGGFGDIPVHGNSTTGSLLYPDTRQLDTIYQKDNSQGMIGAPGWVSNFNSVSKIRGRKAQQIRTDPEVLAGSYADFEGEQKKLYDEVALEGEDQVTMASIASQILKETMANTNVSVYPRWSCTLSNKNMVPLKPVPQKSKYYPPGHWWIWGLDNIRDFYNCGGGGKRRWKTLFDYQWCRVSGVYGCAYDTDAVFDLYVYATEKAFNYWLSQNGLSDFWYT